MKQNISPPKLTKRQQQVLDIIKETISTYGYPPTRVEIAQQLGFRSPNAAEDHLRALARKGVIELIAGTSRGIRLNQIALSSDTNLTKAQQRGASKSTTLAQISTATAQQTAANDPEIQQLAVIGRVAAGSPILATEHIEKELSLGAHLFQAKPDYLLRVRGLSMRDAGILEGDLLAIKKASEARTGQIIVARLGDEVTVKRLETTNDGIVLHAEHPDYAPIQVKQSDSFELEGIAVGLIRDWN